MKKYLKKLKKIAAVVLSLAIMLSLTACGDDFRSYRPIEDINNLENRKIGVNVGWASDYIMSARDDVILYRYDTTADLLMALCYKQLDAIVCESYDWSVISGNSTGLHRIDEEISVNGWLAYVNPNKEEVQIAFNNFIAEFNQTEEYAKWLKRIKDYDGINYEWPSELSFPDEGTPINIAYCEESFPVAYPDSEGNSIGFDMEYICYFCNACNYKPTFIVSSEIDLYMNLRNRYDMGIGYLSELWKEEAELSGFLTTDCYVDVPLYLVEIGDPDNLSIARAADLGL